MKLLKMLYANFQRYPIFFKALILLLLIVTPLNLISFLGGYIDKDTFEFLKRRITQEDFDHLFYELAVFVPLREETLFRGPAYLAFIFLLLLVKILKKCGLKKVFLEENCFGGVIWAEIIVWPALLFLNFIWAMLHPYPLPVFGAGLILSWLMLKTRNILTNMFFHALINTLAIIGARFGLSLFS